MAKHTVARDREIHLLAAKDSANAAGAKIVEEEQRTYLRRAAGLYIQDAENRKAMEAAEQARLVGTYFPSIHAPTRPSQSAMPTDLFHALITKDIVLTYLTFAVYL